jgi:hypothetical protein
MPVRKVTRPADEEIVITPVGEIVNPRTYALYGRAGTGKTTLAGSFPRPSLLIDVNDRGTDSVSDIVGIDVIQVKTWPLFEAIYWDMIEDPDKYEKYKTLIIDTLSSVQQLCVEEVLRRKHKSSAEAGRWGSMTRREWGDVSQEMKSWIVRYRDLPKNIVFIAQDRVNKGGDDDGDDYEEDELMPEVGPALSPAVAKVLNAAVYVIGNTFIRRHVTTKERGGKKIKQEKIQYCMRVGPNPIYVTKIRKPKSVGAPDIIIDPTYDDIASIIEGEE